MTAPILIARGITVRHGHAEAVRDAQIAAWPGRITALVGPNGAGKSSLFGALIGALPGTSGSVRLGDRELTGQEPMRRVAAGLVLVPQGRQIFPRLTVRENLQVIADALALPAASLAEALERFPSLHRRAALPAGVLSGGEQQMLALTRALMSRPRVLLLDEPTLGLAPAIIAEVIRTIAALAESGMAIIIAEPSLRLIRGHIDHGSVMLRGRIIAEVDGAAALEAAYLAAMGAPAA